MNYIIKDYKKPILLRINKDGRTKAHKILEKLLINSKIRFSMYDYVDFNPLIDMENAYITTTKNSLSNIDEEFLLYFKFDKNIMEYKGHYIAEFYIETEEGDSLILPIGDTLNVYIN